MSWDSKRPDGPRYYYRSRRVDGRTIKKYVGCGPAAEMAARMDGIERQERLARQAEWFAEQDRLVAPSALLNEVERIANLLMTAELLLAGFHLHKGQWRKRRDVHGRTSDDDGKRDQAEAVASGANHEVR